MPQTRFHVYVRPCPLWNHPSWQECLPGWITSQGYNLQGEGLRVYRRWKHSSREGDLNSQTAKQAPSCTDVKPFIQVLCYICVALPLFIENARLWKQFQWCSGCFIQDQWFRGKVISIFMTLQMAVGLFLQPWLGLISTTYTTCYIIRPIHCPTQFNLQDGGRKWLWNVSVRL